MNLDEFRNLIPEKMFPNEAYQLGYDCGLNGVSDENCHFSIFSSRDNTKQWEKGKRKAEEIVKKDIEKNKPSKFEIFQDREEQKPLKRRKRNRAGKRDIYDNGYW